MRVVELSAQAEADLADIWYTIALDDLDRADRFIRELRNQAQRLADNPGMGRERSDIRPKLRSFPHGAYLLFYRPTATGVGIARVIHGRRDLTHIDVPDV